jgi:hypothetical protein
MEEKEKSNAEQCSEEIEKVLQQFNCRLIVEKRDFYGQVVYAPVIAEDKTK